MVIKEELGYRLKMSSTHSRKFFLSFSLLPIDGDTTFQLFRAFLSTLAPVSPSSHKNGEAQFASDLALRWVESNKKNRATPIGGQVPGAFKLEHLQPFKPILL